MKARRRGLFAFVLVTFLGGVAYGLPEDRVVTIGIHSNPDDSTSRVQYEVALSLSAVTQDGNWIGWEVVNLTLREKATLGTDTVWSIDYPLVDTEDELWWVEHSDPSQPVRTDFKELAPIVGVALPETPGVKNLDFSIEGVPYAPPPEGAPYASTSAISFRLRLTNETTSDPTKLADDSGADEPVDNDYSNPPPPSKQ